MQLRTVFFTVGSTGFSALISLSVTPAFLKVIRECGFDRILVQYGHSEKEFLQGKLLLEQNQEMLGGISLDGFAYKPSLKEDMEKADLIISHAGSGSILESLRLGGRLIVVTNEELMDNHQLELAVAMEQEGYLVHATCGNLPQVIQTYNQRTIKPFPPANPTIFANVLDKEMGFYIE